MKNDDYVTPSMRITQQARNTSVAVVSDARWPLPLLPHNVLVGFRGQLSRRHLAQDLGPSPFQSM